MSPAALDQLHVCGLALEGMSVLTKLWSNQRVLSASQERMACMVEGKCTLVAGMMVSQPCFSAATRSNVFLHTYVFAPAGKVCRKDVICLTWRHTRR